MRTLTSWGRAFGICMGLWAMLLHGQEVLSKLVADMERKPIFSVEGKETQPQVSFTALTASQGTRSLRFEHTGKGPRRAGIIFPIDGAKGFNSIAFDIYCEEDASPSRLHVRLEQEPEGTTKRGFFDAMLRLGDFIDGWRTVRLAEKAGLEYTSVGGAEPDWGKIRSVSFFLHDGGGRTVFYLDHIRFENLSGLEGTRNLLYNSSFEITTNPDVPDGWGRDLEEPPFGEQVWGIDADVAYVGKKSLRIGLPGKFVRYWVTHLRANQGVDYTFSVYLKAGSPNTTALLQLNGTKDGKKGVVVGGEWERHFVVGKALGGGIFPQVTLTAGGPLWVDAAQLEIGTSATEYAPAVLDTARADELDIVPKASKPAGLPGPVPRARIHRTERPPVIDGELDDPCWKAAERLTPFFDLKENRPAVRQTVARMTFDDRALYFAVRADEPDMRSFWERLAKLPAGPWGADCIEIFLDLYHDKRTYYHFAMNVRGEKWHARHTIPCYFEGAPTEWFARWHVAGKADETGWGVEAEIPYTCFDLRSELQVGPVIGLNICRSDPANRDFSSWAFAAGSFHTPALFGEVSGLEVDLRPYRFSLTGLDWQRGVASAYLKNHTGREETIKVAFLHEAPDQTQNEATSHLIIKDGMGAVLTASLPISGAGFHKLFVRVWDAEGKERLVSQPITLRMEAEALLSLDGTEFDFYTRETGARARAFVEADENRCRDLTLRWEIEQNGKTLLGPSDRRPSPGFNLWHFSLEGLANGAYLLKARLLEKERPIAAAAKSFRKLSPAEHEVRINQWGRFLVCDGKPFFWYGFYDSLYVRHPSSEHRWADVMKDMSQAHCTAVLAYTHTHIKSHDFIRTALDQAHAQRMKMWVHLSWITSHVSPKHASHPQRFQSEEEAFAALREVINQHKTHPALLGWCTIDEPGNYPMAFTKEYTKRFYELVKELDPHHPCIFSHVTRLGDSATYGAATDLALIPFHSERDLRAEKLFQEFWELGLPVVTNAFCYGAIHSPREPTPQEMRARIYKPILLGARGFCSYTYRCASMHTWRELARIGEELQRLAPILLTPDDRLRVQALPHTRDLVALLKFYEGKYYLLALNTAREQTEASFRLLHAPKLMKVSPLLGSPPAVLDETGHVLTTSIPSKSTAFYMLE